MTDSDNFSKGEIGKILNEASRIQTQKDLGDEQQGLNKEELIQVAKELGIEPESLLEAIANKKYELDQEFSWLKGTAELQLVTAVDGELREEQWEEVIRSFRSLTGKIGTARKTGNSFEWGTKADDAGHLHVSLKPQEGKTSVQMISSWGPLKLISNVVSVMAGVVLCLIVFKEIYWKEIALMIAPLGGLLGFTLNRFFLKSFFDKQKRRFHSMLKSVSKSIGKEHTPSIHIDEQEEANERETTGFDNRLRS